MICWLIPLYSLLVLNISKSDLFPPPPPTLLCSHSPTLGSNAIGLFEVNPLRETNVCFS